MSLDSSPTVYHYHCYVKLHDLSAKYSFILQDSEKVFPSTQQYMSVLVILTSSLVLLVVVVAVIVLAVVVVLMAQ